MTPILDGLVNGFVIVVGELLTVVDPRADPGAELVPVLVVGEVPPGADNVDVVPVDEVSVDADPTLVPLPMALVDPVRLSDELGDVGETLDVRDGPGVAIDEGELTLVTGAPMLLAGVEVKAEPLDVLPVPDDAPELGKQGRDSGV